jgi:hypothetical protein
VVIYLKHPTHGNKVAISEDEAKADEKLGWIRYVVGQPVVEVGADAPEGEGDDELSRARAAYREKFGKAPHHKKSAETLQAELAA